MATVTERLGLQRLRLRQLDRDLAKAITASECGDREALQACLDTIVAETHDLSTRLAALVVPSQAS